MCLCMKRAGILYIIATPIGNLGDITLRAVETLQSVDLIVAEDARHSQRLLQHYNIETPTQSLHEESARARHQSFIKRLQAGDSIALISDAGTPLVSDPGYPLVNAAQAANIPIVPMPGPCAAIAALSVSGLPTSEFIFAGFLPKKTAARCQVLTPLKDEPRTMIFYLSPHRLLDTIDDMITTFGETREAVIARELTKTYETIHRAPLTELQTWLKADTDQQKGEFVLLIKGKEKNKEPEIDEKTLKTLEILAAELPHKQAVALTAKITGKKKNQLYDIGIKN